MNYKYVLLKKKRERKCTEYIFMFKYYNNIQCFTIKKHSLFDIYIKFIWDISFFLGKKHVLYITYMSKLYFAPHNYENWS